MELSATRRWLRSLAAGRITTGLWARNREQEVIESVQSALLSALRIPDYDRDIVLDICDVGARIAFH